jgi:hypothetical protein
MTSPAALSATTLASTRRLASWYALSLCRLFSLSAELRALVGSLTLSSAETNDSIRRILRVLAAEQQELSLLDSALKIFLQCRGGQRGLLRRAEEELAGRVSGERTAMLSQRVGRDTVLLTFDRARVFGVDLPFMLSEADEAIMKHHSETGGQQRAVPPSGGLDSPRTVTDPSAVAADLRHLLSEAEPDLLTVNRALEALSDEILNVAIQLSEEIQEIRLSDTGKRNAPNVARIQAALKLVLKWFELLNRCLGGIIRSFGGQQRFFMEHESRQKYAIPSTGDPAYDELLDRLWDQTKKAKEKEAADDHLYIPGSTKDGVSCGGLADEQGGKPGGDTAVLSARASFSTLRDKSSGAERPCILHFRYDKIPIRWRTSASGVRCVRSTTSGREESTSQRVHGIRTILPKEPGFRISL